MKRWRWVFLSILAVGVLGSVAYFTSDFWLTGTINARVASHLQQAYGAPVEVGHVHLGSKESSIHELKVHEAGESARAEPWLRIQDLVTDLSLSDLLHSAFTPHYVTLHGVEVTLRLDRQGHLLTHMPQVAGKRMTLPEIRLEQGQITFHQDGRPDMVVTGIDGILKPDHDHLTLTGTIASPVWGDWDVTGSLDPAKQTGSATLQTPKVHVTQAMLESLPLIPASTWQQVQLDGDTAANCTMQFDLAQRRVQYHLDLHPENTDVQVSSIHLHAEQAQGRVIVQDKTVRLEHVEGQTASGTIRTESVMNFRGTPDVLDFRIQVSRLDLQRLPRNWSLPSVFQGRLSGHADLRLLIAQGKVRTSGHGQGVIDDVRIAGQRAAPIHLQLRPASDRFEFGTTPPPDQNRTSSTAPTGPAGVQLIPSAASGMTWRLAPFSKTTAADATLPSRPPVVAKRMAHLPPAGAPSPPVLTSMEFDLHMEDASLAELLHGFHVQLPFPVSGRVSFRARAAIPLAAPRDLKSYRLQGTVTSPELTVAGARIDTVSAELRYADGVLHLTKLRAAVPSQPVGTAEGTVDVSLVPRGTANASLSFASIPAASLLHLLNHPVEQLRSALSGSIQLQVPLDRLRDPSAYEASGTIQTNALSWRSCTIRDATAPFRLHQDTLSFADARLQWQAASIRGQGQVQLRDGYPYQTSLQIAHANLASVVTQIPQLPAFAGNVSAQSNLRGTLSPFTWESSGSGTATDVQVHGVVAQLLDVQWDASPSHIGLPKIHIEADGGMLDGKADVPLQASQLGMVDVRFQRFGVESFLRFFPSVPVRLQGQADGLLQGTWVAARPGQPTRLSSGHAEIDAARLRVEGLGTERFHASADVRNDRADYQADAGLLGGKLHADGQIPVSEKVAGQQAHLTIEGARLSLLAEAMHRRAWRPLQGLVDLSLNYRTADAGHEPEGRGQFSVRNLRWTTVDLAPALRGELTVTDGQVRIGNLTGGLAGGALRGGGRIDIHRPGAGGFLLALDHANVSQLLAPWPALASRVEGTVDVRLRGSLGQPWTGSGELVLPRGRIAGVEVSDVRVPMDFIVEPRTGGQISVRQATGQVASGHATADVTWTWDGDTRLDGDLHFSNINLQTLLRDLGESSQYGTGLVNGRITFTGLDVQSIDDVTADIQASLQQAQASTLPVLSQILPFLSPGQSSSLTFSNGDVRARLSRGVIRFQRFTLQSSLLKLIVEGTVTVAGLLNLDITANSSPAGFVPLLGSLLSVRLVRLHVTGTHRNPSIQVVPVPALSSDALQFFTGRLNAPGS